MFGKRYKNDRMMKNRQLLLWAVVSAMLCGCSGELPEDRIITVVDYLQADYPYIHLLEYDRRGRLVKYGDTDIEYDGRVIRISEPLVYCDPKREHRITELRRTRRGYRGRSIGKMTIGGKEVIALRTSEYREVGDTLIVTCLYQSPNRQDTLRRGWVKYIYDEERNIKEFFSGYADAGENELNAYGWFEYEKNISYEANLNLQGYLVKTEGTDHFFYMLLNLSERGMRLPERLHYTSDCSEESYDAGGWFRQIGYLVNKAEVVTDEIRVKCRLEFEYTVLLPITPIADPAYIGNANRWLPPIRERLEKLEEQTPLTRASVMWTYLH